ncbi:MAG: hypothetical protein V1777_03405 [Candidatus Micrarchaeota archaeon]
MAATGRRLLRKKMRNVGIRTKVCLKKNAEFARQSFNRARNALKGRRLVVFGDAVPRRRSAFKEKSKKMTWFNFLSEQKAHGVKDRALQLPDLAVFLRNESHLFPRLWKHISRQLQTEREFWYPETETPNVTGNFINDSGMWDQARIMRERRDEIGQLRKELAAVSLSHPEKPQEITRKIQQAKGVYTEYKRRGATPEQLDRVTSHIQALVAEFDQLSINEVQQDKDIHIQIIARLKAMQKLENQIAESKRLARTYLLPGLQQMEEPNPKEMREQVKNEHLTVAKPQHHPMRTASVIAEFLQQEENFHSTKLIKFQSALLMAKSENGLYYHDDHQTPRITGRFETDKKILNSAVKQFLLRNEIRAKVVDAAQPNQSPEKTAQLLIEAEEIEKKINVHKYIVRLNMLVHFQSQPKK